jgi:hypothetical protein
MAVVEGGTTGSLAEVGVAASVPLHTVRHPQPYGALGFYRLAASSGVMAAALAANAELFQFRYAGANLALIYKVSISAGAQVASTAAVAVSVAMTVARSWTAAGTGGTRLLPSGNSNKLRTSMGTTAVNDAGISTTAGLTAGTKTLDALNVGELSIGIGTGAITTSHNLKLIERNALLDADGEGQHPLVLANQEGFVIRNGTIAWPAAMTWKFSVEVLWAEVTAF